MKSSTSMMKNHAYPVLAHNPNSYRRGDALRQVRFSLFLKTASNKRRKLRGAINRMLHARLSQKKIAEIGTRGVWCWIC